jgi:acyl-coenzyme A synthetase/AMP-(fatty) acid ligase
MLTVGSTSGTTGDKKRVIVDSEGELYRAKAEAKALGIGPGSRLAKDRQGIAGWHQTLIAAVSGATLVEWPGPEKRSLRIWLNDERITHLHTLATTFRWLCQGLYTFPTIQHVDIGGEMVNWADFELFKKCFGVNCTFSNRYATAETWTVSRKYLSHDQPSGEGRMPVGKPCDGVEVCIEGGEIVVKSPSMGLGYYDNPELTAAKFRDGWYYTGDKGYWLDNGELMHEGRRP